MDLVSFYLPLNQKNDYYDKRSKLTKEEYLKKIDESTTIYVGSLTPSCSDSFLLELFSYVGPVKKLVMGVNKRNFYPCGFCFVEFYNRKDAEKAVGLLNDTLIGDKRIKIDFDLGYYEGREYGRGKRGGQVEDEKINEGLRTDHFKGESRGRHESSEHREKRSKYS